MCVLLHRNAVIDFIEFWRNGHNPGDESFPFGFPALFEEDMQLQYFLYEQMKNNPNDKSYESRLIVPTKGKVTKFAEAKKFYANLNSPKKMMLTFSDGEGSGKACGPKNFHGYEKIEAYVARAVAQWIIENLPHK